jgi:peptide/nickel transport system substrate-binding protein
MKKRQGMIIDAMKMHADNVYHLPLHLQMIPWTARANVQLIHRADNWLEAAWVRL